MMILSNTHLILVFEIVETHVNDIVRNVIRTPTNDEDEFRNRQKAGDPINKSKGICLASMSLSSMNAGRVAGGRWPWVV
jgi:hypothetical protein